MNRTATAHRTVRRTAGLLAPALLAAALLAACSGEDAGPDAPPPVTVSQVPGPGGLKQVTLTDAAAERLAVRTAPATAPAGGTTGASVTIPYAAVVYTADGATWTYVQSGGPHSYVRRRVDVVSVAGDMVNLSAGPAIGTPVVVVGAPELMGAEAGISGEE